VLFQLCLFLINYSLQDPNHPERGYYWGGQQANGADFTMKFRIPASLVGEQVMMQWHYITANSCSPPDYAGYFGGTNSLNEELPEEFWSAGISNCVPPYPQDGATSGIWPEHFWNCAEVTILGEPEPTISPVPTKAPIVPTPTNPPQPSPTNPPQILPTNSPVTSPTSGGTMGDGCCSQDFKTCVTWCTESMDACDNCPNVLMTWLPDGPISSTCLARWETCTANQSGCCNGMLCRGDQYYMQCQHPSEGGVVTDPDPDDSPTPAVITPPPTNMTGDNDETCGEEWASCFEDQDLCCEDQFCDLSTVANNYAHCRRSPTACLLNWMHCNDDPDGCCEGLSCKGDSSWKMCQE
jgi:hypothetical protein